MASWVFNFIFSIFLTVTYFITSATTILLGYTEKDVGGNWALAAALAAWSVVLISFAVMLYEAVASASIFDSTVWSVIVIGTLLVLMIVVAVLSIVTIAIIKSSGRESDIEVAFADCVFSVFLSFASIVLLIAVIILGGGRSTNYIEGSKNTSVSLMLLNK